VRSPLLCVAFTVLGCAGQSASISGNGGASGVAGGSSIPQAGATGGATNVGDNKATGGTSSGGSHTGGASGASNTVRACTDTSTTPNVQACRSSTDCKELPPVKCCTPGNCWTGAATCPFPPSMCSTTGGHPSQCSQNSDCDGGTCTITVSGCPECPTGQCQYPPPKCTQNPDSCGSDRRCASDGTCVPLLCNAGFSCPTGSRCAIDSTRSDGHGCELIPCTDGWTCDTNTRCTAPSDSASHGCTVLTCTADSDCDCGYCVNGGCLANLGICTQPAV